MAAPACAQCGQVVGHAPGCALGQITAPLQGIRGGVDDINANLVAGQEVQAAQLSGIQGQLATGNRIAAGQLAVGALQLGALVAINGQLQAVAALQHQQVQLQQAQMMEQKRQGLLQELLFQLEKTVEELQALARTDPVAAAVVGHMRVNELEAGGVAAEHFHAIEHKRAYQKGITALRSLGASLPSRMQDRVAGFARALPEFNALTRAVGAGTEDQVSEWRGAADTLQRRGESTQASAKSLSKAVWGLGLGFLALFWFTVYSLFSSGKLEEAGPAPYAAAFCLFGVLVAATMQSSKSSDARIQLRKAKEHSERAETLADAIGRLEDFKGRLDGGMLLGQMAYEFESLRFAGWEQLPRPEGDRQPVEDPTPEQELEPEIEAADAWFVQSGDMLVGPVAAAVVIAGVRSGELGGSTMVWRDGKTDWVRIQEVREFSEAFSASRNAPPPPPKLAPPAYLKQGDDDPFAALDSLSPEQKLRAAVREALADGVVTEHERGELQKLQAALGIPADVVRRIVQEERAKNV